MISEKQVFISNYQESLNKKDALLKIVRDQSGQNMQEAKRHMTKTIEGFKEQLARHK